MVKKIVIIGLLVVLWGWTLVAVGQAATPPGPEYGWEYVVQSDDWLVKLAEKYLGDGNLWPLIVRETNNRAVTDRRLTVIRDPNLIYPGQVIFIPTVKPRVIPPTPPPVTPRVSRSTPTPPARVEPVEAAFGLGSLCRDSHPAVQAFCAEIPIARIHLHPYEGTEYFTCASRNGLGNVQFDPNAVTILVPNDGDFDLSGIVAAIKVAPDQSVLIPRWPGSRFDFSAEYAREFKLPVGEQWEIPLAKAFELIKAGELIWTGKHGEPGKAGLFQTHPPLTCDPQADFEIVIGPF